MGGGVRSKAAYVPGSRTGRYPLRCPRARPPVRNAVRGRVTCLFRATVRARGPLWLVPRGGRPADDRHGFRIPRGPRTAVRVLAGLSSAFPRPSLDRSAGQAGRPRGTLFRSCCPGAEGIRGFGLAISRLLKVLAGGAWLPASGRSRP